MIQKDYSIEGTIMLIMVKEPQLKMMVTMEEHPPFVITEITEQDRLDGFVRVKQLGGSDYASRVAIKDLRRIVLEYEDESVKPEYAMTRTQQLPLDSTQWQYVLKHNLIRTKARFEVVMKKELSDDFIPNRKLSDKQARLVVGKRLITDEELYELGEACYNFRTQQQQGKTDVSFREWFKSKFL